MICYITAILQKLAFNYSRTQKKFIKTIAKYPFIFQVLKIRVRVDGHVKCDEAAPRYQFAPPNDYGEVGGEQETATTSLMEGSVAHVGGPNMMYNNGMFNNNCPQPPGGPGGMPPPGPAGSRPGPPGVQQQAPPSSNGDRSLLFRKSNGSKPVREWYV